jgi:alpha-beta hydrolase superfamily lysophospholipase
MAEHILRYEPFAAFLAKNGFIVSGHDQVGHGKSVQAPEDLGHLPAKGGADILLGDIDRMRRLTLTKTGPDLPYFLFGHSMGSFETRAYIARSPEGLTGAIICGTGQVPAAVASAGRTLAHAIAKAYGDRHVSKLLGDLTIGGYAKAIADALSEFDWLSYDRDNIRTYIADRLCGFPFTAAANVALMDLISLSGSKRNLEQVPDALPLLYISGDADPVGEMGKAVRMRANQAKEAGKTDITCRIYENRRHEILNDTGKEEVMADILKWMEDRL